MRTPTSAVDPFLDRTFGAPNRYIQGPGLLSRVGQYASQHGSKALVVVDEAVRRLVADPVEQSLRAAGLDFEFASVSGQVTRENIAGLVERVRDFDFDVVLGIGGGKALDLAKGVARQLGTRMITCPTIASNDGPTARVLAIYDEHDVLVELGLLDANPDCVLVDTEVIANAPAIFLVAGIGDALAKRFEAHGCAQGSGLTTQGTRPLLTGESIARACYDVLLANALAALSAVERKTVTPELEAVVEAVVLMSGLGYENGGLSIAHCMTRGLMVSRGTCTRLHGFHVAYGLMVQLVLEGWSEDLVLEVRDFLQAVGLPISLAELGMPDATATEIMTLAIAARTAPHLANTLADTSEKQLVRAIHAVETGRLSMPGGQISKADSGVREGTTSPSKG